MVRTSLYESRLNPPDLTLSQRFLQVNWGMLLLVALIACVGLAMLYSAADQSWTPWALRQAIRFGVAFGLCVVVAVIPIGFWLRWSYLGYAFVLALLVGVEVAGEIGMGAQRWINLGFMQRDGDNTYHHY